MRFLVLSYIFAAIATTTYSLAIDFSQPLTSTQMNCLSNTNNETFIFIRAYMSTNNGMFDTNVCNTYQMSKEYHNIFPYIYMIPSTTGAKSAEDQIQEMINGVSNSNCGLHNKLYWFNLWVTNPQNWNSDPFKNFRFIKKIVASANEHGWSVLNIYTNEKDWNQITNNADKNQLMQSNLGLWWANAPNSGEAPQNTNDFKPFGGWTRPTITQYSKNAAVCGISCNKEFS